MVRIPESRKNEEIEINRENQRVLIKDNKTHPDMISETPFSKILKITHISK